MFSRIKWLFLWCLKWGRIECKPGNFVFCWKGWRVTYFVISRVECDAEWAELEQGRMWDFSRVECEACTQWINKSVGWYLNPVKSIWILIFPGVNQFVGSFCAARSNAPCGPQPQVLGSRVCCSVSRTTPTLNLGGLWGSVCGFFGMEFDWGNYRSLWPNLSGWWISLFIYLLNIYSVIWINIQTHLYIYIYIHTSLSLYICI